MTPNVEKHFFCDIADHTLTLAKDEGLYRHLQFRKPGTGMYWFDIVTYPGALVIDGDMGTYVFRRLQDMFDFFRGHPVPNVSYWSEKLRAPEPSGVMTYSPEVAEKWLREQLAEWLADLDDDHDQNARAQLTDAIEELITGWGAPLRDEHELRSALRDFDVRRHCFTDVWECDFREYDYRYLWCLWAIIWGIQQYDQFKEIS